MKVVEEYPVVAVPRSAGFPLSDAVEHAPALGTGEFPV
jgi:hypothetical protein